MSSKRSDQSARRRRFLGALASLALGVGGSAGAQPIRTRFRIGTLTTAWAANHPALEGLREGLAALGVQEGRDAVFEHRYVEGELGRLSSVAASLVASGVEVLFTVAENATRAAAQASTTLPVVFANVDDPIASGLVRALGRPGGNVTGVSNLSTELAPKRLETLKALVPGIHRVWTIYDGRGGPAARRAADRLREAASAVRIDLVDRPVRTPSELKATLDAVRPGDGLLPIEDGGTTLNIAAQSLETAARVKAPTVFSSAFWLQWGALAAYGADHHAVGYQAAHLVRKVLTGSPPQDVPVEGANRIELAINLRVAAALGIKIPQSVLVRADKVIE